MWVGTCLQNSWCVTSVTAVTSVIIDCFRAATQGTKEVLFHFYYLSSFRLPLQRFIESKLRIRQWKQCEKKLYPNLPQSSMSTMEAFWKEIEIAKWHPKCDFPPIYVIQMRQSWVLIRKNFSNLPTVGVGAGVRGRKIFILRMWCNNNLCVLVCCPALHVTLGWDTPLTFWQIIQTFKQPQHIYCNRF